ncbi:MAG: glycosyltransferase family 4 protein [Actinobacteria bacterium]|nr:glycosyltransferase family 4 protein [Actinomycetota bacterium]
MRIAVIHGLPPGGALRWAHDTTVHLAATHDVEVFEVGLGTGIAHSWPSTVQVSRWAVGLPRKLPGNLTQIMLQRPWRRAQRQLANVLDNGNYDVVLAHPCQVTQGPAALSLTTRPTVYFMQEVRRRSYEAGYRDRPTGTWARRAAAASAVAAEDAWPRRIDRQAVAASTVVLANSAFTAEACLRTYGREAVPCLLGIDTRAFCLSTTNVRRDHLLLVGGLERNKGALWLIEALGRLGQPRPPLVITGQRAYGPYVDELLAAAHRCGVALDIRQNVDESALVALYQAAVATCCVSRLEPFGLTTIESLACGTPVVGFREGGFREVVRDGENGRLAARSTVALADAVADVIDRRWDSSALRASVVPEFDIVTAVRRLTGHLQSVVTR